MRGTPLDADDDAAIAFDYRGKGITLDTQLPVAEATPILAALRRRLPSDAYLQE